MNVPPFRNRIRVRYAEIDGQGVVFNAHWLTYFDDSCTRFMESLGFGPDFWVSEFDVMLVKATLEWSGPARFDEWIDIVVEPVRLGTKSFDLRYTARWANVPRAPRSSPTSPIAAGSTRRSRSPTGCAPRSRRASRRRDRPGRRARRQPGRGVPALDGGADLDVVLDSIPPGASVLDLGSGPGRIANPLARAGHDVVAVDDSQAMLDHVEGATTVLADLWTLDLGRTFDVVLALSHLINDPGHARRVQLLEVCARHVTRDGVVLVQRLPLGWTPAEERRTVGDVTVHMHDVELLPNGFRASNTYTVGDRSWTQAYESEWVDDAELDACAIDRRPPRRPRPRRSPPLDRLPPARIRSDVRAQRCHQLEALTRVSMHCATASTTWSFQRAATTWTATGRLPTLRNGEHDRGGAGEAPRELPHVVGVDRLSPRWRGLGGRRNEQRVDRRHALRASGVGSDPSPTAAARSRVRRAGRGSSSGA